MVEGQGLLALFIPSKFRDQHRNPLTKPQFDFRGDAKSPKPQTLNIKGLKKSGNLVLSNRPAASKSNQAVREQVKQVLVLCFYIYIYTLQ